MEMEIKQSFFTRFDDTIQNTLRGQLYNFAKA